MQNYRICQGRLRDTCLSTPAPAAYHLPRYAPWLGHNLAVSMSRDVKSPEASRSPLGASSLISRSFFCGARSVRLRKPENLLLDSRGYCKAGGCDASWKSTHLVMSQAHLTKKKTRVTEVSSKIRRKNNGLMVQKIRPLFFLTLPFLAHSRFDAQ